MKKPVFDSSRLVRFTHLKDEIPDYKLKRTAFFGHLPGVRLDTDLIRTGPVAIDALPFERWVEFEGLSAWDWHGYYGEQQAFACIGIDNDVSFESVELDEWRGVGKYISWVAWLAIILTYEKFLPSPELSLKYVLFRAVDGSARFWRGPGHSDFDLLRSSSVTIQETHRAELCSNIELIASIPSERTHLARSVTQPFAGVAFEAQLSDAWLDLVVRLETLLNPEGKPPLAARFASSLVEATGMQDQVDRDEIYEIGRRLYSYRSSVFHGRKANIEDLARRLSHQDFPFPFRILRCLCEQLLTGTFGAADRPLGEQRRIARILLPPATVGAREVTPSISTRSLMRSIRKWPYPWRAPVLRPRVRLTTRPRLLLCPNRSTPPRPMAARKRLWTMDSRTMPQPSPAQCIPSLLPLQTKLA